MFRIQITRWTLEGRRVPAGTPGATQEKSESKKWYATVPGCKKPVPLSHNKALAQRRLAELLAGAERARLGFADPAVEHHARPLLDQLAEFRGDVAAGRRGRKKPPSARAVADVVRRVKRVLAGCGFAFGRDLDLAKAQAYLAELGQGEDAPEVPDRPFFRVAEVRALCGGARGDTLARTCRERGLDRVGAASAVRYPRATVLALVAGRGRGLGGCAIAEHARDLRRFSRWLVRRGRLARDVFADLVARRPDSDHRHERRPLAEAEVEQLLATVRASRRSYRGLAGRDRWLVYLVTLSTGFRREEVAGLTPRHFHLDHDPPRVVLGEAETKNDRGAVQPLPPEVAEALRGYLTGRAAPEPLWPGTWWLDAADMQRRDLAEAGIAYIVDGPDGPLYADFHALRHTFIAMLKRSGATLSQAMRLARHSDPALTIRRYGREDLPELGGAVGKLAVAAMVAERTPGEGQPEAAKGGQGGSGAGRSGKRKPRADKGSGGEGRRNAD